MAAIVRPRSAQITDLTSLLGAVPYSTAKLHLSSSNFAPTPSSVLTDFSANEISVVGYSAKSLTWSLPYRDTDGNIVANAGGTFIAGAVVTAETAYTAYITDTASGVLLASWQLDTPIAFAQAGDGGTVEAYISLENGQANQTP